MVTDKQNIDILLVEDEPDLGLVLSRYLRFKEISVVWSPSAEQALEECKSTAFKVVVIDVQLPHMDGFDLAKQLQRIKPNQAFFFLTAQQENKSKLLGLELGAIDYIGKPFEMEELVLKLKNVLKLQVEKPLEETVKEPLNIGNVVLYLDRLILELANGKQQKLTVREAEILEFFMRNKNLLLQKKDILQRFWGNTDYFSGKSLEVFVSRLRKMLQSADKIRIESVYGAGYIFVVS
ncbi:response regulator transcription factor [Sphingobacterium sp. Mn56C]|uniref:response regulator transcription factor n=1 Tax=Sphingobacterium sp. Mn56C TaxID=3395261 RepID=UPI003BE09D05